MTGRELAAAIRPLEAWATAIGRFSQLAQEAIRLEEGLAQGTARLTALEATLATTQADLARLHAEARDLTATLAAERAAAEHETAERCAARVAVADSAVADRQRAVGEWTSKLETARAEHERRMAGWAAEEAALRTHVDGLRELAQRMARAAEAVPR